jgi:uncharacterized protein (TIGR03086 family)
MTAPQRQPAAVSGGVGLLERAINYTLGSLQLVTPDALGCRTPCPDWDLLALLRHLADSFSALREAVDVGYVALAPDGLADPASRTEPAGDPVAALRSSACQLLGAWTGSGGRHLVAVGDQALAVGVVGVAGAVEVAVHGWDVAEACGRHRPIPPGLADALLPLTPLLVTDADRPSRFASPVRLPRAATPGDRLVAYLGRDPG